MPVIPPSTAVQLLVTIAGNEIIVDQLNEPAPVLSTTTLFDQSNNLSGAIDAIENFIFSL
ncbi:MAG TPA: hypothetical protein VGK24_05840 [Candidatus Angelobacter sp.]|jgi:hypothetical protein